VALLRAGNLAGALCDFADDAVVILPGQIASGIDTTVDREPDRL
jgi:hypothetical protein